MQFFLSGGGSKGWTIHKNASENREVSRVQDVSKSRRWELESGRAKRQEPQRKRPKKALAPRGLSQEIPRARSQLVDRKVGFWLALHVKKSQALGERGSGHGAPYSTEPEAAQPLLQPSVDPSWVSSPGPSAFQRTAEPLWGGQHWHSRERLASAHCCFSGMTDFTTL